MHVCALVRPREFFRSLGTASRLSRFLKLPVAYRVPDRQCIVLNAKPDADLFGSDHVTVCATWPHVKLAEFDNRQMWISVFLTAIHRVLQWRYHFCATMSLLYTHHSFRDSVFARLRNQSAASATITCYCPGPITNLSALSRPADSFLHSWWRNNRISLFSATNISLKNSISEC